MKTKLIILALTLTCSVPAMSKGFIIYSEGEDVEHVLTLPNEEEFQIQASNGQWYHADLGILHEQFSIFWVPLFNYGTEKYVLYTDEKIGGYDFTYVDLSRDDVKYLQECFEDIPTKPELPFWDAWGGKLVVFAVVALLILAGVAGKKD